MENHSYIYPFTAIVGQAKMKKSLILNAINPLIGGVLIRGEKGTAKSTAVRALAKILPSIEVTKECSFNCNPASEEKLCPTCKESLHKGSLLKINRPVQMVELPVSATEDRVIGSLDFEHAIKFGEPRFEPGLLARAHRGILYVDEVNLLDDHLVDVILDAVVQGVNIVEREGVSYSHSSEFILVGTMNAEEGDLRPQLLDRFGLCVQVEGVKIPVERVEVIKRREVFEDSPQEFYEFWSRQENLLKQKIIFAQEILPRVTVSQEILTLISKLCLEVSVAGHRADIFMVHTSRTLAAWAGRIMVQEEDVYEAAELVLFHRSRDMSPPEDQQKEHEDKEENKENQDPGEEQRDSQEQEHDQKKENQPPANEENNQKNDSYYDEEISDKEEPPIIQPTNHKEEIFSIGESFAVRKISLDKDRVLRKGSGRRSRTRTPSRMGRYIRSTTVRSNNDIAFDATLRAAAPYQQKRQKAGLYFVIHEKDIREKVREKKIGNFLLFVVDASGSMGAQQRMVETKGAILSLLLDAYQKRDKIGMIAFKGDSAELMLPPTSSVERAQKLLEDLPTGGKTPLSAGLSKAYEVARIQLYRDPNTSPLLIIISDGKANVCHGEDKPLKEARQMAAWIGDEDRIRTLVVDVEREGFISFGLAKEFAELMNAHYYRIEELKRDSLLEAVRKAQ